MPQSELTLRLSDAAATEILGSALARTLPSVNDASASPSACVLYLRGELGAGKTTCARSLLHALGVAGVVRSPTYTLVETYAAGRWNCVHIDLYRLRGPADLEDLGLRDYLTAGQLLLIEWPERGGASLPSADLDLSLSYAKDGRSARLRGAGVLGERWLENLRHDTSLIPYLSNLT
jgi:tRNA threonylcarbamoyladenosine biosynthesis protein TsaE